MQDVYKRPAKDCAEREDETGKKVVKFLFVLILVSQILLGLSLIHIFPIVTSRAER